MSGNEFAKNGERVATEPNGNGHSCLLCAENGRKHDELTVFAAMMHLHEEHGATLYEIAVNGQGSLLVRNDAKPSSS